VARAHARLEIAVKKKTPAKDSLVEMATCNMSVTILLVARLCALELTAAIMKHRAQTLRAAKAWSRHLKVDVEPWNVQKPSVARKKALAQVSSVVQAFTKACLMITAVAKSHAKGRIAATLSQPVMTTGAPKEWSRAVTLAVVVLTPARMSSAACQRHLVQTSHAEKAWSRPSKVDAEQWNAQWSSVARKKTLVLASSVDQASTKACLTVMVATRFRALKKIAVTQRRTAMTTVALKEWFAVATLVVVALELAQTSSAVCQRRTAVTTCVRTACSSQMMGLVVQPVALMISVA